MDKGKKYFFLIGSLKMGGTERNAALIGQELLRRGYDVRFIVYKKIFDLADDVIMKQVILLSDGGAKRSAVKLIYIWFNLVRQLLIHRPASLVSFSTGSNILAFSTLYPRIVFTVDTNIFYFKSRLYRRYLQKYLSIFPNVKRVIIPSEGLKNAVAEYFIAKRKVTRIYNPVDLDAVFEQAPAPLADYPFLKPKEFIVTAGRLVPGKRIEHLIQAFASSPVSRRYRLVILGTGRLQGALEKLVQDLGMSNAVHVLGFQSNPYRFFSKARYFILNSEFESFANVLIEALASGTPVVSNDCDFGPREIIKPGENGFLYRKELPEDFQSALARLADDTVLYEHVSGQCVRSVERFSLKRIVDEWEALI